MVSELVDIIDSLTKESEALQESVEEKDNAVRMLTEECTNMEARFKAQKVEPKPVVKQKREVPLLESIVDAPVKVMSTAKVPTNTDVRLVGIVQRVGNK